MSNLFNQIRTEHKKQEQEIRNRERQDQYKGVRRAERARVCKLIRENSTRFWSPDTEPTRNLVDHIPKLSLIIDEEILNKIEKGEL